MHEQTSFSWVLVGIIAAALLVALFLTGKDDTRQVKYLAYETVRTQAVSYRQEFKYLNEGEIIENNPRLAELVVAGAVTVDARASSAELEVTSGEMSVWVSMADGVVTAVSCEHMGNSCPSTDQLNKL